MSERKLKLVRDVLRFVLCCFWISRKSFPAASNDVVQVIDESFPLLGLGQGQKETKDNSI